MVGWLGDVGLGTEKEGVTRDVYVTSRENPSFYMSVMGDHVKHITKKSRRNL